MVSPSSPMNKVAALDIQLIYSSLMACKLSTFAEVTENISPRLPVNCQVFYNN